MIRIATPHNNLNLTPNSQMNLNRFNPLSSDFVYGKLNVIDSTATTTAAKNLNLDHSHNHNQTQDQNQSQVSTRNIAKTLPSHEPPLLMNSNSGNADLGDWGIDEDYTPTVATTTFSGFLSPTTSSLSSTTGHQHPHAQTNANVNANANNNNNASSNTNTNAISHSQSHLNTLLTNLPAELLRHPQQFYQTQQLQHTYYNTPKQPITRQLSLQYLNGRNPLEDEPYLPPHPQYITNGKRRNSTSLSSSLKFQQQQQQGQRQLQLQLLHHQDLTWVQNHAPGLLEYCQWENIVIIPTTETITKYIKKYLSMENTFDQFWEKFRYNLITSHFLDDTMSISKDNTNENALHRDKKSFKERTFRFLTNDDGTKLHVLNTSYKMLHNKKFSNSTSILCLINMIIFLLKQQQKMQITDDIQYMAPDSQFKLFKIILILASKAIKVRKFRAILETNKALNGLDEFFNVNLVMNKNLVSNLIVLRNECNGVSILEESSTNPLDANIQDQSFYRNTLTMQSCLSILNLNLRYLISKLMSIVDSDIFQQYCTLHNINFAILTKESPDEISIEHEKRTMEDEVNFILFGINKFNQLRKFFICQLLSLGDISSSNFFTLTLMDQFGMANEPLNQSLKLEQKVQLLYKLLSTFNSAASSLNNLFAMAGPRSINTGNTTQKLSQKDYDTISMSLSLFQFTLKVQSLSNSLTYFNKYNESLAMNNMDEQLEKLLIFKNFGDDLNQLKLMHKQTLAELNQQVNPDLSHTNISAASECSSSSPKSTINGNSSNSNKAFHMKSFHNAKKRFSLPPSQTIEQNAEKSLQKQPNDSSDDKGNKKYNRLSTGLQLGLLTVYEDDNRHKIENTKNGHNCEKRNSSSSTTSASASALSASASASASASLLPPPKVSYDDNYINILPSNNQFESYNQSTLDQLNAAVSSRRSHNIKSSTGNDRGSGSNNGIIATSTVASAIDTTNTTNNNNINNNDNNNNKTKTINNHHTTNDLANVRSGNRYSSIVANNRFSLNSVQSNVSGLSELISTRLTKYAAEEEDENQEQSYIKSMPQHTMMLPPQKLFGDKNNNFNPENNCNHDIGVVNEVVEDDSVDKGMSKEELQMKLEASFNKIYNLENENRMLRGKGPVQYEDHSGGSNGVATDGNNGVDTNVDTGNAPESISSITSGEEKESFTVTMPTSSFLTDLELKLNQKT